MLKIVKSIAGEDGMQLSLIGRLQVDHLAEVRDLIRLQRCSVVLDLREIRLVDRAAIEFLAECESDGVLLRNCAPYIRHWVTLEAARRSFSSTIEGD